MYDKKFLHLESSEKDPPGESPNDCPVVCLDLIPHNTHYNNGRGSDPNGSSFNSNDDSSYRSYGGSQRNKYNKVWKKSNNVIWVDPKSVNDEKDVDYNVLRQYELLSGGCGATRQEGYDDHKVMGGEMRFQNGSGSVDPPSSNYYNPHTPSNYNSVNILSNPRTRIATISSGYKKANYFVREDLDTRIYFHTIEDAIGYMAKRGYSKMRGEEEREWRVLLGRAHGVVKVRTFS